nr:4-alpha-glucanotransferase [Candidatus Pantoea persica]
MKESALDRAALAAGISLTYNNAKGEPEAISDDTKSALLAIMGEAS